MTELLNPDVLSDLLDSLFPRNDRPDPLTNCESFEWSDDWSVQQSEISNVISKKTASATKAPGPDGFDLIVWKRTPGKILEWIRHIFNECLKKGVSYCVETSLFSFDPKGIEIWCSGGQTA